jgi:hypothetical protein
MKNWTLEQRQYFNLNYEIKLNDWLDNGKSEVEFIDFKISELEEKINQIKETSIGNYIKKIEEYDKLNKEPFPLRGSEEFSFIKEMQSRLKDYYDKEKYDIRQRAEFLKKQKEEILPYFNLELIEYNKKKNRLPIKGGKNLPKNNFRGITLTNQDRYDILNSFFEINEIYKKYSIDNNTKDELISSILNINKNNAQQLRNGSYQAKSKQDIKNIIDELKGIV